MSQKDGECKWELTEQERAIWDSELPSFFKESVIDPVFELDTYGMEVGKAAQRKLLKQLFRHCLVEPVDEIGEKLIKEIRKGEKYRMASGVKGIVISGNSISQASL